MVIKITEKWVNKILILTSWEGNSWCGVRGLAEKDQSPETILEAKQDMIWAAERPNAPRNGIRKATKC
jgi:hypothetical protein